MSLQKHFKTFLLKMQKHNVVFSVPNYTYLITGFWIFLPEYL